MLPYRTAAGQTMARRFAPPGWVLAAALLAAVATVIALIAGGMAGEVLVTLAQGAFVLPIVIPAVLLGVVLTGPLARAGAFEASPWPDALRVILGTALGLGAMSLAMLALGSAGLLGNHIPLAVPVLAAGAGYLPARTFFRTFDRGPLTQATSPRDWLVLAAAVPVAVMLIAATYGPGFLWVCEGRGYDVLEYHLQCPREYLAAGSTAPLRHNAYSFLPANVEMLYLLAMALVRSFEPAHASVFAIFPAQLLHALFMLLTAGAVALAPLNLPRAARWVALLAFMGTPWVLVTGSLAYNEGGMLLFGALAMVLALAPQREPRPAWWVTPVFLGVLLGLAVGSKLTAGTMVALPVAAVLLLRRQWKTLPAVVAVALAVYAPWGIRAAAATGNPLFPMATQTLGRGHWTTAQAQRWDRAHAAPAGFDTLGGRLHGLLRESVGDPYWSFTPNGDTTLSPQLAGRDPRDPRRPGVLWAGALVGIALAVWRGPQAWVLVGVILVQLACWLTLTHLQARFLLPVLVPLAWLIGMGAGELRAGRVVLIALVMAHATLAGLVLLPETALLLGPRTNPRNGQPYPQAIGITLSQPEDLVPAGVPQPKLPGNVTTYLLGDATPLYYHGRVHYATVFDVDPLLETLRRDGPGAARQMLAQKKVNYLVVRWSEIARLARSYGYEQGMEPQKDAAQLAAYLKDLGAQVEQLTAGMIEPFPIEGGRVYEVLEPGAERQ